MYSEEYARYITRLLDENYHQVVSQIIDLVPADGILKFSTFEISHKLGISEAKISEAIEIMQHHKIPMLKLKGNKFIFDYRTKEIKYVEHLRRAQSNMLLSEDD